MRAAWSGIGLMLAALLALGLASCGAVDQPPSPAPGTSMTSAPLSTPRPTPIPSATPEPTPLPSIEAIPPAASTDAGGMQRSGIAPSGAFAANTITAQPATDQPNLFDYVVKVETSIPLDADSVARQMQEVLDSPRGWTGTRGAGFALVADTPKPAFTIYLAAPATVDKACGDLQTMGIWSCRMGDKVWFNVDRWLYGTPVWADRELSEYRAYMINHEVGHYLGFGHVGCPAPGAPSPVMQQQSINPNGCLPNAWPDLTGEQRA